MQKLSIITNFYNSAEQVRQQLVHWKSFDKGLLAQLQFIIVDDGSRNTFKVLKENLNLRYFKVLTDMSWNSGGARNLGTQHSSCSWMLMMDIDQKIIEKSLQSILANLSNFKDDTIYLFKTDNLKSPITGQKVEVHPNTILVKRDQFLKAGMYDEDFSHGYGCEDLYLLKSWEKHGKKIVELKDRSYFVDMDHQTEVKRDMRRNMALMEHKIKSGYPKPVRHCRYAWIEMKL